MAAGDPGTRKRNYSATAIQTTLVSSITSAATDDTTASVSFVSVSGFPGTVPYTLILEPDTSREEVVTVLSIVGSTASIKRGQDNTQAVSHAAGATVRHGISAREFKELQTHIAARGYDADSGILSNVDTHVHGLVSGDGSVVGADQAVTLTRKTLTTPTINGATLTGTITSTASIVISGSGSITGLSSTGMSSSSAAPKSYVDSIIGSATAASTSATSAATSAASAATSATSASNSAAAAATSASSASTSASSALTSQNAAATSAFSASTSASSALTSQNAAATSATSASTSATSAATSASSASTSASSASTSASSALTSANSAATSASSAATSASSADASYVSITGQTGSGLVRDMGLITDTDTTSTTYINIATVATSAQNSATAAATSATSAATSATSAATSATSAATSATSAATSATSAASSATAAASSATAAASSATQAAGYIPAITAGVNGYFLTNNGTTASWASLSDWGTV